MSLSAKRRHFFVAAASIVLAVWCGWFVWKDDALSQALTQGHPLGIAGVCACMIVFLWSNGLVLNTTIARSGVLLTGTESMHLSVVTNAGNSFFPLSAGMALRALYLKRKHGVSLSYFMGALAGVYVINFAVVFVCGSVVMWRFFALGNMRALPWALGFTAAACALFAVAAKPQWVNLMPEFLARRARALCEGWIRLLADKKACFTLLALVILNIVVSSVMMIASFHAVGIGLKPFAAVSLSVVNSLAIFVKITPGNLGVNELLLAGAGTALQLDPGLVVLASAVSRLGQYGTLLVLLPVSLWSLFGREGWRILKAATTTDEGATAPLPAPQAPPKGPT